MSYQIDINGNIKDFEILNRNENSISARIDGKVYDLDLLETEPGLFNIIYKGKNFNFEVIPKENKTFQVATSKNTLEIEIIDAESRYMKNRKGAEEEDAAYISTPMPGQVVKILVEEGQEVKGGETVIIVSAMKMESEYKVVKDRIIKEILVKEGDNIEGDQPLILFE